MAEGTLPRTPSTASHADPDEQTDAEPSSGIRTLQRITSLNPWGLRDESHDSPFSRHEREWTIFGELLQATEHDAPTSHSSTPRVARKTPSQVAGSRQLSNAFSDVQSPALSSTLRSRSFAGTSELRRASKAGSTKPSTPYGQVADEEPVLGRHLGTLKESSPVSLFSDDSRSRILSFVHLQRVDKNIIKCVLAYWLASLFTFVPFLSATMSSIVSRNSDLRPSPSAHMVATIAVYYAPAKTVGAMVEANIFCVSAIIFTSVICVCSMEGFWAIDIHAGWEWLADTLVLLWIAVAMFFIAWVKLWMSKPSFNPACWMAVVVLFVVIIHEGGIDALLQVLFIVLLGVVISNAVCFLIWPESAVTRLQMNMSTSLRSLSDLLRIISESFLYGDESQPPKRRISDVINGHQAVFTKLKSSLEEARSEWLDPRMASSSSYETAVDCFTHLAQHMTGLRDGAKLHNELRERCSSGKTEALDSQGRAVSSTANVVLESVERDLAPSLTVLIGACCKSLESAGKAVEPTQTADIDDVGEMREEVDLALSKFSRISDRMVLDLYRGSDGSRVDNARNEAVFHVYFFIFTLQEFAHETITLMKSMEEISNAERRLHQLSFFRRRFAWPLSRPDPPRSTSLVDRQDRTTPSAEGKQHRPRRMSMTIPTLLSKEIKPTKSIFPKLQPHAPNTQQTPAPTSLPATWRLRRLLWAIGARMKDPHFKYALKTGIATAMLAAPAFLESTRPIFVEYRGEWALIAFFLTMGPTIGATNLLGLQRIFGTIFGAYTAALMFALFPDNPVVLSLFGALFSYPCFYLIVRSPRHSASARFVLLTYNLTCLYSYNLRRGEIPVHAIAMKRSVGVTIGVAWAFIVSRWWWPLEARRQLGVALSDFCQQMGWLYSRLVRSYSIPPSLLFHHAALDAPNHPQTELSPLLSIYNTSEPYVQSFPVMERHLQTKLIELQALLAQTEHEPRLKGPFPVKLYRSMLTRLQVILDKLHSMRCVTMREEWFTAVHWDFIMPVQKERREMVGNVILYFATLSAAFRLKAPLPPYLPPAEQSRVRLIEALRAADAGRNSRDSRHLLYYAYASAMHGVIQELEGLGRTLQDAFGVIGDGTHQFEALFDNTLLEEALLLEE